MTVSPATTRRAARLGALGVVVVLAVLAVQRLDLARVLAELSVARPHWIGLALLSFVLILPLWAMQWRLLAPDDSRPRYSTMVGVVAMTSTVLNTAPMLVGEAAGIYFLVVEAGLARAAALSVLAMDQLFVGIAKLVVLGAAAAAVALPVWMARGAQALVIAVGALLVALVIIARRPGRVSARLSRVLPARLTMLLAAAGTSLAPLRSSRRSGGALALALAKKLAEACAILCVQRAFGVTLSPTSAVFILAATNLATLLPVVPGNLGVYEAAVVVAYAWLGVPPERALGIALVQHACYFAALALPGYRWLARRVRDRSAAAA